MTNDRIKELALANGFKLKEQPDGSMDLNHYVFDFARALLAEHRKWKPLSDQILGSMMTGGKKKYQLLDTNDNVLTGVYKFMANGSDVHGFIVDGQWISAKHIVEVMINP